MDARLQELCTQLEWPTLTGTTKLHGDASARSYFRLMHDDGSTHILMVMPEGAMSASEEISNFQGAMAKPSFLLMADAMASVELPIPQVLHFSPEDHWIILEDLGDEVLGNTVSNADSATRCAWYQRAIDLMVLMQQRMGGMPKEHCVALQRSFDAKLLNWEFDHFAEYLIGGRGKSLTTHDHETFITLTRNITDDILALPYRFTHRDFQSRNLMIKFDALYVIDFQDALLGPYIYDMVSLCRDSYIALSPEELDQLMTYGAKAMDIPLNDFRHAFNLVAAQRKMKDAGRFVYIDQVKKNPNFLPFIPASLAYVRSALEQLPVGPQLLTLLTPYVPEWQS